MTPYTAEELVFALKLLSAKDRATVDKILADAIERAITKAVATLRANAAVPTNCVFSDDEES